jgi:hypothetical protein
MDKKFSAKPRSLTDNDISSQRSITRRSLLGAMGIGLGAAAATVVGAGTGAAQQGGCTDSDIGANQDMPGYGRRCRPFGGPQSGCTDNDAGAYEDPPGGGRYCGPGGGGPGGPGSDRPKACTDNDNGPTQDPPGLGVRCWT